MTTFDPITQMTDKEFDAFFRRYRADLFHYVKHMVPDVERAKDIVMESFRKMLEYRSKFESKDHVIKFLFVATRNQALNFKRWREGREVSFETLELDVVTNGEILRELIIADHRNEIRKQVKKLPERQRQVITLVMLDQSSKEIAETLDMTMANVRVTKSDAIKALQKMIDTAKIFIWII